MSSFGHKGASLESQVLDIVRIFVNQCKLGLNSKNCRVYQKKKYYSKDRNGYIETDISIELFIEGADTYSLLWVWECKDYNSYIPVDDVEEFHAKLQQIGADNTKGTIITRGYFQRSAINFAQSKKIGLCRLLPTEQIEWKLYYQTSLDVQLSPSFSQKLLSALTIDDFIGEYDFYGLSSESVGIPILEIFVEIELQHFINYELKK